jgi:hypothetical protein
MNIPFPPPPPPDAVTYVSGNGYQIYDDASITTGAPVKINYISPPPPPPLRIDETALPKQSIRREILEEAADLVDGDRNDQYGDPIGDFRCTADMWAAYLRRKADVPADFQLNPHDVAAMMSLLKISRIGWSPDKRDHWADLAGYAACGYDCSLRQDEQ